MSPVVIGPSGSSSLNFGFALPGDASPMSDIATYMNGNWTKVVNIAPAVSSSSVPDQNFTYKEGDRLYVTGGSDPSGIYVCIGSDPVWGVFWRPMTAAYGPWRQPSLGNANAILKDPATFQVNTSNPFQYRLTNRGKIQFRGCIQKITGTWPDVTDVSGTGSGYSYDLFNAFPRTIWPGWEDPTSPLIGAVPSTYQIQAAGYPMNSNPASTQDFEVLWDPTNKSFIVRAVGVSTGSLTVFDLFLSGSEYCLGTMGLA